MNTRKKLYVILLLLIVCVYTFVQFLENQQLITSGSESFSFEELLHHPVGTQQLNLASNNTCPDGNIITVGFGGQLGNRIWEYLSLYAAYKLYKDECRFYPYVPMEVKEHVELVFQKLRIPTLQDIPEVCIQERETIVIGGHDDIPVKELEGKNAILELSTYSARYEFVADYGFDNIRRELKFKPEYVTEVNTNLRSLKKKYFKENDDVVFVGIHYRGTDYVHLIKKYLHDSFEGPPTYEYYNKAMSYFQERYEKIIFILVTIDIEWIKENKAGFKKDVNLAINPFESDKIKDMVLLSHCNHTIMAYGSFASTTALFAGGTTFVYDLKVPLNIKGPILAMGLASRLPNCISLPVWEDIPAECEIARRKNISIDHYTYISKDKLPENEKVVIILTKWSARYEFVVPFGFENMRKEARFIIFYKTMGLSWGGEHKGPRGYKQPSATPRVFIIQFNEVFIACS